MTRQIQFFVPGTARPGGSKRAFMNKRSGKICVVEDCRDNKNWRADIQTRFLQAQGMSFGRSPVQLELQFFFQRPKSHYGTGKKAECVKSSAPHYHAQKPDATKLIRAVEDALTGLAWHDDAQVCRQIVEKHWCGPGTLMPGVWIRIQELDGGGSIPIPL